MANERAQSGSDIFSSRTSSGGEGLAAFAKQAECADPLPISPHRLRHRWASEMIRCGIRLLRIRQYGFLSNRERRKKPASCRLLLGAMGPSRPGPAIDQQSNEAKPT